MPNSLLSTCTKLQISKLQTKLQAVSPSALYIENYPCFHFGQGTIKVSTVLSSSIDTVTSSLNNQT